MTSKVFNHWPLLGVLLVYTVIMIELIIGVVSQTNGPFIYPMDDTYIHMAIAKNASEHGVWGITRYQFSSSTSSPLWTLLLTVLYSVFWVDDRFPLVMTLAVSPALIALIYVTLRRTLTVPIRIFGVLLLAVLAGPVPALALTGMEHVLHATFALLFVITASRALTESQRTYYVVALIVAPLMVATRYEAVFAVVLVCSAFLLARRWLKAILLGVSALLPLAAYGLWSMSHGWHFLPNSVLVKSGLPTSLHDMVLHFVLNLPVLTFFHFSQYAELVLLLFAGLISLVPLLNGSRRWDESFAGVAIGIGMILLHVTFANYGWFYRYEAYLVVLGVVVVFPGVVRLFSDSRQAISSRPFLVLFVAFSGPFIWRSVGSLAIAPVASKNIYEQQYQMARFVRDYYPGQRVALNDVGAVSYLSEVRLLDLYGLGTLETGDRRRQNRPNTETIGRVTRKAGTKVAIVYDKAFGGRIGGLPRRWEKIGEWRIPNNTVCADDTVSFYATEQAAGSELRRNLITFSPSLPPDVIERGAYINFSLTAR